MAVDAADPFVQALERDDDHAVAHFLASGRSASERLGFRRSPLHVAAQFGSHRCLEMLLAFGADVEAMDSSGHTPLVKAVEAGHTGTAAALLGAGARISYTIHSPYSAAEGEVMRPVLDGIPTDGSALRPHAQSSMPSMKQPGGIVSRNAAESELVDRLLAMMAAPRDVLIIHYCRDLPTLQLLVEQYGAKINEVDPNGDWPLATFAAAGLVDGVAWLLAHGAEPDLTYNGATALHYAVGGDHVECARLLLNAGANPNAQDTDGCVALRSVSSNAMLDLLLAHKADANLGDQCDFKPSYWVNKPELRARMESLEASPGGAYIMPPATSAPHSRTPHSSPP